mmetsp:Transcript_23218/g.38927  ORF Transcript_23218/g.38927 Transcript_23218/m.38927 type:complete len:93 (-) Transcript_23218:313-591(-)
MPGYFLGETFAELGDRDRDVWEEDEGERDVRGRFGEMGRRLPVLAVCGDAKVIGLREDETWGGVAERWGLEGERSRAMTGFLHEADRNSARG